MRDPIQPPGDYIRLELESRGWGQADLARILDRPLPTVNEIIQGKKAIMPQMAVALGTAFATGPEVWMRRESEYRLSLVEQRNPEVSRRAKLYEMAPVKEMEKRGWIKSVDSVDGLETELCRFFNVPNLDQEPIINAAARQTFKSSQLNPIQKTWCFRAAKIAKTMQAKPYREGNLETGMAEIVALADYPERTKKLSAVLAEIGIRLVIVEPLQKSKIDGAAFWLSDDAPVIVLSMRYDRIDGFWFTLMHELSHIRHRDSQSIDSNMIGEEREGATTDLEERADREAAESLIPSEKMHSFVVRVKPFYSKVKINQFAQRMHIHPGIIVGQLQHMKEIPYGANREMLAKVRDQVIQTALTDGWGRMIPTL